MDAVEQSRSPRSAHAARAMRAEEAEHVVALAVRAPSLHNTQPWTFTLRRGALELRADRSRQLPGTDPDGRQLVLSCGAALFGVRLGVRALGYLPQVELVPDDWDPDLLARVHLGSAAPADTEAVSLVNAVARRRSLRSGFAAGDVAEGTLAAARQAAAGERTVLLVLTEPTRRMAVAELVAAADRAQRASTEAVRELAQWTSRSPLAADGLPPGAWPDHPPKRSPGEFPARDFAARGVAAASRLGARQQENAAPAAESAGHPLAAALLTRGDTPVDWLRAGQALHRVLLTVACAGVQASLHSQPFGLLGLRRLVREELTGGAEPEMLLQFGYPVDADAGRPASPRRPVHDVLTVG